MALESDCDHKEAQDPVVLLSFATQESPTTDSAAIHSSLVRALRHAQRVLRSNRPPTSIYLELHRVRIPKSTSPPMLEANCSSVNRKALWGKDRHESDLENESDQPLIHKKRRTATLCILEGIKAIRRRAHLRREHERSRKRKRKRKRRRPGG